MPRRKEENEKVTKNTGFTIRPDSIIKEKLKKTAARNQRSLQKECVYILTEHIYNLEKNDAINNI